MGLFRHLTQYFTKEVEDQIKPKTIGTSSKADKNIWTDTGPGARSTELLSRYITVYEKGGLLSEAFDLYPIFMFSQGYEFIGDPGGIEACESFVDGFDFSKTLTLMVIGSLVCADSFAEVAPGRGAMSRTPVAMLPRDPTQFSIVFDDRGISEAYEQKVGFDKKIRLEKNEICHVQMIPSLRGSYGVSLMARCFDEAMRDTRIVTGLSNAIDRHGTPKWLGRVGATPESIVDQESLDLITTTLSNLNSKTSIAVPKSVEVQQLDTSGIQGVQAYQEMSLLRLLGAIGVPGELVGWRQGTTDNTAVSRIRAFLLKCESYNRALARQLNLQVFDQVTGNSGSVKIQFKSLLPDEIADKTAWIVNLMKADPLDPYGIITKEQIQEKLGLI